MDKVSKEQRSRNMSRIRHKDTKPELLVRKFLHSKGFRYRLHDKKLPGKPDLVLPKYKTCIFVNGCFWHKPLDKRCGNCRLPKTNKNFWKKKFSGNLKRDASNIEAIKNLGWKPVLIWECDLDKPDTLTRLEKEIQIHK